MKDSLVDGAWEAELDRRAVLLIQPDSAVAVKQDSRRLLVSASARDFTRAFAAAMAEPDGSFGLVQLMRKRSRRGLPFELGERFQGRFSLRLVLRQEARRSAWMARVNAGAEQLAAARGSGPLRGLLRRAETTLTSDFGQIVELETEQLPSRLRYVYLQGSYMAGSCSFVIEPAGERLCRVTSTWQYQERHWPTVLWIGMSVLKLHLAVVYSQIAISAERAGARIVESEIPPEYVGAQT